MEFAQIKGQNRAITILQQETLHGRNSHAYLFYGPEGVGKAQTALILAQALNCRAPIDGNPCGQCPDCQKIRCGNHPDVTMLKADGATVKIHQIRLLQERVFFKCYEGKNKVIMMDDAHLMTQEAANSLLKLLEEPPSNTVFILLAQDLAALPSTIVSRCRLIPFSPLDPETIRGILAEHGFQNPVSPDLARGSAARALQLAKEADIDGLKDTLKRLLNDIQGKGYRELSNWAAQWESDREKAEEMLALLVAFYRDRAVALATHKQGHAGFIEGLSECSVETCLKAVDIIDRVFYYLKYNANMRLSLEVMLYNLQKLHKQERGV